MAGRAIVRRRALLVAALLAAGAIAGAGSAGRDASAAAKAHAGGHARQPRGHSALYWGAWIGPQLTGAEAPWSYGAVIRFEQLAKKSISLVHFSSPFANCSGQPCTSYPFPRAPFQTIRANGAIPFFSWSSASLPVAPLEPGYTLRAVAEGRFDRYIARWATAARRWGHPFFLRFDWEMNSSTFPWSVAANGNAPWQFVAAWRHVHDVFARVGARNATWVWCPNADPEGDPRALAALYPGDSYVDWTCLDGYNSADPWRSFATIFQADYAEIAERVAPGKPMILGETASTEIGGDKATWIAQMFASLPRFPKIRGLIWFDRQTGGADWPAESSPAALAAFARGLGGQPFAGSRYGNLDSSPIPPAWEG